MNIGRQNRSGYALAISSNRVVGAKRSALFHYLEVYLGPGSKVAEEQRQQANKIFSEILTNKDLELLKDSITRISWKQEGFFDGGHFLFNTKQGDFQIDTRPRRGDLSVVKTTNTIIPSLEAFAPDRFFNEKTGGNMRQEFLARLAKKGRR